MSKKVLIRKQAGGGLQYQVTQQGSAPKTSFLGNIAALRGGARGLVTDPNNPNNVRQGFIPGAELGAAKPTGMQRLAAGANVAGTGLAAALTGLQTAYGLQGGNVGALASAKDQYRANVGGLTGGSPTEAQQAQNMATEAFNQQQQTMAQNAVQQTAQQTMNQPVNVGSSSPRSPAPAGLPTPPVPAQTTPAPAPAAPTQPGQTTLEQFPQPAATSVSPTAAAQLLPPAPTGEPATSNPINPTVAGEMLPTLPQQPTPPPSNPQFSGPMDNDNQKSAAPVAVSQPVDNGLTPHQGTLPVMKPQQTHEGMRQQVAVRPPVATPYTPGSGVNPFAADKKPIQPHMVGRQTIPGTAYGGQNPNTVHPDSLYGPNFGIKPYASAVPSLGDDPSINWDDFKRAFVSQVFDEFGDMLHKADPHTVGAVVMRVFLDKMLRKRLI